MSNKDDLTKLLLAYSSKLGKEAKSFSLDELVAQIKKDLLNESKEVQGDIEEICTTQFGDKEKEAKILLDFMENFLSYMIQLAMRYKGFGK